MTKIWKIIKHEYKRHVFRKRFLVSLLSLPLVIVAMVVVALLIGKFSVDTTPIGYIDQAAIINEPILNVESEDIFDPAFTFLPYANEEKAAEDLNSGEIQAFFKIPEEYLETLNIELFYLETPDYNIQRQFSSILREKIKVFEDLDPEVKKRLEEGSSVTMASLDGSREMREDQWYLTFIPFIAGIMFIIVVMTSGGYLLQAVAEEKENRTIEIVITSVSPGQLMTGKIIGDISVGLTQLLVWLIFGWIGLKFGGQFWPILQDFSLPTNYIIFMLLIMLPSFVMISALMAAIGSTVTEVREAQQVSGMISVPIMIPYYISSIIMNNPNGTLATVLSYFPLTSPITIMMRMAFTVIPLWQIAINIAILVAFAIVAIWFAGRAFRMGMLRYGKKLSVKEILRKRNE